MESVDIEEARKKIAYNPETGEFTRLGGQGGTKIFVRITSKGYSKIALMNKRIFAHRLAWFLHNGEWPDGIVDHINGKRSDNRIANLRLATPSQNAANAKVYASNTSGFKGVSERSPGKFRAYIYKDKKMIRLGQFPTAEEAYAAHVAAATNLHGEFFRAVAP